MPYKRTYRKRSYRKAKKRTYKRYNRKLLIGNPSQKVFYFKRHVELSALTAAADGVDSFINYQFNLANLDNYTDFVNMFEYYKICAVKIRFLPQFTQYSASAFNAQSLPGNLRIFSIVDYNSISTATIAAMRQYSNCKVTQYVKGHRRYIKPRTNIQGDNADVQIPGKNPWVDTGNVVCDYLGMRVAIDTSNYPTGSIAPGDPLLRVEATYYIACKQVH